MPVLNSYGCPAAMEPEAVRHLAVYSGWRDHVLPLVLSGKLMPGTLFIVAEHDWRTEKGGSLVSERDLLHDVQACGRSSSVARSESSIGRRIDNLPESCVASEDQHVDWGSDDEDEWRPWPRLVPACPAEPLAITTRSRAQPLARAWKPKNADIAFPQTLTEIVRICTFGLRKTLATWYG